MIRGMTPLFAALVLLHPMASAQVTPPEKFFGFQLGADRKMARWDKIVEYFSLLEKQGSGRMKVVNMGPSTMGNPFLVAYISSPANLSKLERLREVNAAISDPRGRTEAEIRKLIGEGKAVMVQTMSLHATEIGGSQMAPELAYDLLSANDEDTRRILDGVIFLMVPSFNPDGQIMVTDYYRKTLGSEYEGSNLPWLYHKYAGHDNNRDAFQTNLVESQYLAKIMFREWIPQAYVDHHHMGSYGARISIPPYAEPIRPHGDPLVWREMAWYGAHMAYKAEEADLSGVIGAAIYSGWGHFGFHWITPFHNIAGMLTESASARLATPLYIHPQQLRGGARAMPDYNAQTTFPNPWPGGWWRLRDIVERQKVTAWALLDLAARNRETVLWNAYLKAKRQTDRGAQGKPAAYVIPAMQHDRLTAIKLVNKLLVQGVEVQRAGKAFASSQGMSYPEGSYVVPMAQPKMGLIRYLLGRTYYPDNEWTRDGDGTPIRPYDMAADTMFEFMGVRVDALDEAINGASLAKVGSAVEPQGRVTRGSAGYWFDGRLNGSFRVVNWLLERAIPVRRVHQAAHGLRPGDFIVAAGAESALAGIAKETGVDFQALNADASASSRQVNRQRVAMYQRYRGGNMDEGWTRLLLEQFGFPYTSLAAEEVKKGGLRDRYDAIILPDDGTNTIMGEQAESRGGERRPPESYPPEYRGGIGNDGLKALTEFLEKGGTVVALGAASNFAIEKLGLQVRNVVSNANPKEYFCPGSTLRVEFERGSAFAYGMPEEGLIVQLANSPVFEILPSGKNDDYEVVVRFADRDLLESGWLIGEQRIAKKAAMVAAKVGGGRVVMIGFRTQHRAQTHGTFKLLFNALM
ncbi:MAG: peptidase M14 family protein [Acidimicrobiia bacterium]|nr:peptidase M14 family protein [Acidimicrobiia bacterium]